MSKLDMSKIDASRIDTDKIDTSRIDGDRIVEREDTNMAVRILRSWHGYAVGAIIRPPGSVREILLEAKDKAGKPIAELVEDGVLASTEAAAPELAAVQDKAKPRRR